MNNKELFDSVFNGSSFNSTVHNELTKWSEQQDDMRVEQDADMLWYDWLVYLSDNYNERAQMLLTLSNQLSIFTDDTVAKLLMLASVNDCTVEYYGTSFGNTDGDYMMKTAMSNVKQLAFAAFARFRKHELKEVFLKVHYLFDYKMIENLKVLSEDEYNKYLEWEEKEFERQCNSDRYDSCYCDPWYDEREKRTRSAYYYNYGRRELDEIRDKNRELKFGRHPEYLGRKTTVQWVNGKVKYIYKGVKRT